MEPLSEVRWDVVLGGTGLAESLLALCVHLEPSHVLIPVTDDGAAQLALAQ